MINGMLSTFVEITIRLMTVSCIVTRHGYSETRKSQCKTFHFTTQCKGQWWAQLHYCS